MKPKITLLVLFFLMGINSAFSQFTTQKPDLRLCGSPPSYYEGYFNCTSNNYTLDQVFISLTNVNGVPLSNTTCVPGTSQQMYVMLNYTSNSSSAISQTRIFADLSIDGVIIPLNIYLGTVLPGAGQRQIYGPFTWTCGQQLRLCRILTVWQTSGEPTDPELSSYDCNTYSKSQCEFASCMLVAAPLAVHYTSTGCNNNGNQFAVAFQDHTTGGIAPYTYSWNFGDGSPLSTQQNPTHNFAYPGGPYTVTLTITDSNTPTHLVGTYTQVITPPGPITITGNVNSASCINQSNGSIDVSVTGGTAPYTYSWSNSATTQDLAGLAPGTYTVTVTDVFGCTKSQTFTINNGDTSNPVVTAPNDITIEGCGTTAISERPYSATPATITLAQFTAAGGTYTDATAVTITYQDVATGSCPTIVTRTFRFTDTCGNVGTDQQIITINDTTLPVISTLPAPTTINCPAVPQFAVATATDNCAGFTLTHNDVTTPGQCAGSYSITRTWTATDACGNTSTKTQTINVQDVTAPVIAALPAPTTITCPAVPQFAQATATDGCNSVFTLTYNDVTTTGQCPGSYSVTRTWTAVDACQNSSTRSQTITVQDITAPVPPQAPANVTVSCSGDIPPMISLTANDACDGPITVVGHDAITSGSCTSSFTVTRTWTFVDACRNTSSVTQTINVSDTSDPVLPTPPADITVSCDSEVPPMISLTASDTCAGQITVTGVDSRTDGSCPNSYVITRTWRFTDPCGNTDYVSQIITVSDVEPPVAPQAPSDITVSCGAEVPAMITLTANDNCHGDMIAEGVDVITPGDCVNSYTVVRTWTFVDACDNTTIRRQTITVLDNVPPVLPEAPVGLNLSCVSEVPAPVSLTAVDNCSGNITSESVDTIVQGSCPNSFVVTRTWTFIDQCGNPSSLTQIITVSDQTGPELVGNLSDETVTCGNIPTPLNLQFRDNCGGEVTVTFEEHIDQGSVVEGTYDIIRTWTVTDICGNPTIFPQTIHVTVGDTFSADNPEFCKNDTAFANFNLMSLLPRGTEPGGQWIGVNLPLGVINHTTNTINATQLPVGYYTLQYILTTDQSPCPRKLEFYVHVDDKCGVLAECAINVFNGFSPDGDGENDILVIDGLQCYAENNVQIYNRWGILVFDKSGYNNTTVYFDGKSEGRSTLNKNELLPGGTYFYIVQYKDNEAGNWHDKSGYLYLSR